MRIFTLLILALAAISVSAPVHAQTGFYALQDSAEAAISHAERTGLAAYAPGHVERARKAYGDAQALDRAGGDQNLTSIKYRVTLDELTAARRAAQNVRSQIPGAVAARTAAHEVRADSLVPDTWQRAEQQFSKTVRDLESGSEVPPSANDDIAGIYRAARRDALRSGVLGQVWRLRDDMDRKRTERTFPALTLRVHQAISRAEAALAQDNLDVARTEGELAARLAQRTLSVLEHVERSQKSSSSWESALLPYDDALDAVAEYYGTSLDYSKGIVGISRSLMEQVRAKEDSLRQRLAELEQTNESLERSLADAQTSLADVQNRTVELERRMATAEGERSTTRAKLQLSDQISRAQGRFPAGQAMVAQNERGQVVIRLVGLKFASGAARLDKAASSLLDRVAEAIEEFPGATISVEAHTDADGTDKANQQLSEQRARSVSRYLASKLQLPDNYIGSVGHGESRPIADNRTAAGKAENRRVEIILTPAK